VRAAVVFVDYVNSPEAKYPTQNEQAYAAMLYAVEHAKELNVDASRLAIAGDSVGGNMSAVVTLLAKERRGPKIAYQVLFYPLVDYLSDTASYQKYADGPWLTRRTMKWMFDLQGLDGSEDYHAYPLRATVEQLRGLPDALLITDDDILQDEGEAYAYKLGAGGRAGDHRAVQRDGARLRHAQPAGPDARRARRHPAGHHRPPVRPARVTRAPGAPRTPPHFARARNDNAQQTAGRLLVLAPVAAADGQRPTTLPCGTSCSCTAPTRTAPATPRSSRCSAPVGSA
jgi:acetyl esterase/lipase